MLKLSLRRVVGIAVLSSACLLTFGATAFAQSGGTVEVVAAQASPEPGVLIVSVQPDSPAAKAGVSRGDIVLEANGTTVNSAPELHKAILALRAGDSLTLTVQHGDETRALEISLGEQDGQPFLGVVPFGMMTAAPGMASAVRIMPAPGFMPDVARRIQLSDTIGVHIAEVLPDSPAAEAGLQTGDLIVALDGESLTPKEDFAARIAAHQPGDEITLRIQQEGDPEAETEITVTLGARPEDSASAYLGVRVMPLAPFQLKSIAGPGADGRPLPGMKHFRFFGGEHFKPMRPMLPPMMPPMMMMPYGYWMGAPGYGPPPFAQPYGGFIYIMPAQPAWPPYDQGAIVHAPFAASPGGPGVEGVWSWGWNPDVIQATPAEPFQVQPAPVEIEMITDEAI